MFLSVMVSQGFSLSCLHFPLSAIRTFTQLTNCVVFVPETKREQAAEFSCLLKDIVQKRPLGHTG
jgi:hypothetical protein